MRIPYGWLSLFSLAAAVYLFFIYDPHPRPSCGDNCFSVEAGKKWILTYTPGNKSVKGLAKTRAVVSALVVEGDTLFLNDTIYNEGEDFSKGISQIGFSIKHVNVTSITDEFAIKIGYHIPDNPEWVGKQLEIITQALVEYPKLDGSDDVLTRSSENEFTYTIVTKLIEYTVKVNIIPLLAEPSGRHRWIAWGMVVLFFFSLYKFGANLPDEENNANDDKNTSEEGIPST